MSPSLSHSVELESDSFFSVLIPIDPKTIIRNSASKPNLESLMQNPDKEGIELLPGNGVLSTPPPPPGLSRNNNKQTRFFVDNNKNDNSNGNGYINNVFSEDSNPRRSCSKTTTLNSIQENHHHLPSNYSQSPFNPLAIMTLNENDTPVYVTCDENANEELSLASNHFKLFVDEALKKVGADYSSVKTRLIIPAPYSQTGKKTPDRWGLKIFGPSADLVNAAKQEIMRSPSLCTPLEEEDVDFEASLRTSKTIELLLFEEGDVDTVSTNLNFKESKMINFPVLTSLSGLLLGPKQHVIKYALVEFDCIISWDGSLSFLPTNSSFNLRVSGKDPKAVSLLIHWLKNRSDRIDEISLAFTTLVIDSGKLDWIYSSGAIKDIDYALWNTGGTLTRLSDSIYQVTCLSGALLTSCLTRLHAVLSRHQSIHLTFRFRNDFRDFTTKCSEAFESLSQATDCVVSQRCGDGCVSVEIGGSGKDLSRALIQLDNIRAKIFETGSGDLKLAEKRLRLHLPAEIRDFICGKKDGKLNRIVKETGVKISLNLIGGDSMYVDLIAEDHKGDDDDTFSSNSLLNALRLLEGELPSELTFHVPDAHHKRMIGHGGKVIQRIMKKWGVYVKFMNHQETTQCHRLVDPLMEASPVGVPLDNVVVRTPSKNAAALKAIKEEIFEECSVSEITGQFDHESFKMLKKIQGTSKSRVSITLPPVNRQYLSTLLRLSCNDEHVDSSLLMGSEGDVLILEGDKGEVAAIISVLAKELKNELEFCESERWEDEIILKSPIILESPSMSSSSFSSFSQSSNLSASSESFKFFPSALFVVQSHQSNSANGSPITSLTELENNNNRFLNHQERNFDFPSPASSVTMNSMSPMNLSPTLPVGHHQKKLQLQSSQSEEINFNLALAETRRRSADIF